MNFVGYGASFGIDPHNIDMNLTGLLKYHLLVSNASLYNMPYNWHIKTFLVSFLLNLKPVLNKLSCVSLSAGHA